MKKGKRSEEQRYMLRGKQWVIGSAHRIVRWQVKKDLSYKVYVVLLVESFLLLLLQSIAPLSNNETRRSFKKLHKAACSAHRIFSSVFVHHKVPKPAKKKMTSSCQLCNDFTFWKEKSVRLTVLQTKSFRGIGFGKICKLARPSFLGVGKVLC